VEVRGIKSDFDLGNELAIEATVPEPKPKPKLKPKLELSTIADT